MAAAGYSSSPRPLLCAKAPPAAQVFLGGDHTIIKGRDGKLYSCGRGDSGQLGHGNHYHYFEPTRIAALTMTVRLVSAGASRTVAITKLDDFYIFGKAWGDGHGGVKVPRGCKPHTPAIVEALSKKCIDSVSLGEEHGAACNNIGTVYTFGSSNDHLQLGTVAPRAPQTPAEQVEPLSLQVNESTSVRQVVCGENHTLAVTSEDEGYAWGCNMSGQLGLGHKRPAQRPALLRYFKKADSPKLVSIAFSGGDFNAVLVSAASGPDKGKGNELFMWGRNLYGQLGLGHTTEMAAPQRMLRLGDGVRLLCCGPNHVLAAVGESSIYAWGRGVHGQLGNGYVSKQTTPRLITNLAQLGAKVVSLGAGGNHSACVTEQGALYTWGSDLYGQLGVGEGDSSSLANQNRAPAAEGEDLDQSLSAPVKFDGNASVSGSFGTISRDHFNRSQKVLSTSPQRMRGGRQPNIGRFGASAPRQNPQEAAARKARRAKLKLPESGTDSFIMDLERRLKSNRSGSGAMSPPASPGPEGLAPLETSFNPFSPPPLRMGDFSHHEMFSRTTKERRAKGKRVGTLKFIDQLLEARDDEAWIAAHPEEWMRMKQERGGPTPDPLEEENVFDGRIR